VPVGTPDTTSFLRNALGGCAVLFKKVVLRKAVLFKPRVGGSAKIRRPAGPLTPLIVAAGQPTRNSRTSE
jgi:hypothetical protein